MANNLIPLTEVTLSLGLAYLFHSTLLLVGVAIVLRRIHSTSHTLRERLWKAAVVVPLLTASLQIWVGVAPIPAGWSVSVVSVEASSGSQFSARNAESSNVESAGVATTVEVESASGMAADLASLTENIPSLSSTVAGEPPSFDVRQPSSSGEATVLAANSTGGNFEVAVPDGTPLTPVEVEEVETVPSELTATVAGLAPAGPLPESTSTSEPRTTQPDWPPTKPPKISRSEPTTILDVPLMERRVTGSADATSQIGETSVASPSLAATHRQPVVQLKPVAFGITLAVLASLVVGLLLLVVQRICFWRRLRTCRPVEDGVTRRELEGLLQRKGIRRPIRLFVSSGFAEPVAYGVFRQTIIVPHGVERRLNREQIAGLLAHELAHLVRGDTAWLWVGNIVCSCLSFQPLNFLARRRWQQAAEFLCDEWAVADANVSPISLAQCLTKIAEWRLDRQESGAILAAGGHRSTLSSRIDSLVRDERPHDVWKSRRRQRAILLGVLAVGIGLVWSVPRAEFVHADSPPDASRDADAVDEWPGSNKVSPRNGTTGGSLHSTPATLTSNSDPDRASVTGLDSDAGSAVAIPPETLGPFELPGRRVEAKTSQQIVDWQAEWVELQAELKGLNADLIRVAELLEKYPGHAQVRELAELVRARAVSFEARRVSLDERLKVSRKDAATTENGAAATPDLHILKDDVQYFPPGPEFRLPPPE